MKIAAICFSLLLSLLSCAAMPQDSVVFVEAGSRMGQGTIVANADKHTWILTAAHVAGPDYAGTITQKNHSTGGRLIASWEEQDLALYLVFSELGPVMPIAKNSISFGTPVCMVSLQAHAGPVCGNFLGYVLETEFLGITTASAIPGDSGSPMVNSNNELIGVVVSILVEGPEEKTLQTLFIPAETVRRFLSLAGVPLPP